MRDTVVVVIIVIIPLCRRISSLRILSHVAASTYVDVALSRCRQVTKQTTVF